MFSTNALRWTVAISRIRKVADVAGTDATHGSIPTGKRQWQRRQAVGPPPFPVASFVTRATSDQPVKVGGEKIRMIHCGKEGPRGTHTLCIQINKLINQSKYYL